MKILVRDNKGDTIFTNIEGICVKCEQECKSEGALLKCPKNAVLEIRNGKKIVSNGSFFLCCSKTKTTKLFKEKMEMLIYTIPTLKEIKDEVYEKTKQREQDKYQRIVHNLRTINAQSVQEQFNLVPQDVLAENYPDQLRYVMDIISKEPEKAATTFLRLAKNNANIKTEFVTHEKLSIENPVLTANKHNIRKVILNVFHAFSLEFKNQNIRLEIFSENKILTFDYDTVRVAFYHLFQNASKYVKPYSVLKIECSENNSSFSVKFKMESIYISDSEVDKIFEDNYSGIRVVERNKQGAGLGMGLIKKALELNNASIIVHAGQEIEKKHKTEYSKNVFEVIFNY